MRRGGSGMPCSKRPRFAPARLFGHYVHSDGEGDSAREILRATGTVSNNRFFSAGPGCAPPRVACRKQLAELRFDKRLLFVGPAGEPSALRVYYTISHPAYPRPVAAIFCGEPGKSRTSAIERAGRSAEIAGLIFFETDPGPWAAGGTRVAPSLYISPHNGAGTWDSFCR